MPWQSLLSKALFLGIPFLFALWAVPQTRKEIDVEIDAELKKKFG